MIPRNIFKYLRLAKEQEQPQSTEQQIEDLVNRLILKLKADGKSIDKEHISKGFGSLDITVHQLGEEDSFINICSGYSDDDWFIKIKPHFNKF